jgi:hypothetical protein
MGCGERRRNPDASLRRVSGLRESGNQGDAGGKRRGTGGNSEI